MSWFIPFFPPVHPAKAAEPQKLGAKPSRHNPQPNYAPTGKRRRQWR